MKSFVRNFIAVFLIGIGIMLVLDNIGMINFGFGLFWHYLYPIFILIMGLKWSFDFLIKRGTHWFLGLFFTVFGGLLLLDRFEVITFYFNDIFKLWPLLIIYIGFMIIGFNRGNVIFYDIGNDKKFDKKIKTNNFTIGSQEFSQPNWKVEPMNINTMAGDFYLDFSKAFIPEKETPIQIRSLAGDVHILMPKTIEFRLDAKVKAGEIEVDGNEVSGINRTYYYETDQYEEAVRKIDFIINLKAGAIRIDLV